MSRVKFSAIDKSPYKDEITGLILNGTTPTEIFKLMKDKYGEDFNINYQAVRRQRMKILNGIEETASTSHLRNQAIQSQIYKDVQSVQMLGNSLRILSNQLAKVARSVNNKEERKEVRDIVLSIDKVTSTLLRYSDKIQTKPEFSEEDLLNKIIDCFEGFPSELQIKFIERWKKIEL